MAALLFAVDFGFRKVEPKSGGVEGFARVAAQGAGVDHFGEAGLFERAAGGLGFAEIFERFEKSALEAGFLELEVVDLW